VYSNGVVNWNQAAKYIKAWIQHNIYQIEITCDRSAPTSRNPTPRPNQIKQENYNVPGQAKCYIVIYKMLTLPV
jgi:hypothetical protein